MDRRVTYPQEFRFPTFPPPQGFVFVRGDFITIDRSNSAFFVCDTSPRRLREYNRNTGFNFVFDLTNKEVAGDDADEWRPQSRPHLFNYAYFACLMVRWNCYTFTFTVDALDLGLIDLFGHLYYPERSWDRVRLRYRSGGLLDLVEIFGKDLDALEKPMDFHHTHLMDLTYGRPTAEQALARILPQFNRWRAYGTFEVISFPVGAFPRFSRDIEADRHNHRNQRMSIVLKCATDEDVQAVNIEKRRYAAEVANLGIEWSCRAVPYGFFPLFDATSGKFVDVRDTNENRAHAWLDKISDLVIALLPARLPIYVMLWLFEYAYPDTLCVPEVRRLRHIQTMWNNYERVLATRTTPSSPSSSPVKQRKLEPAPAAAAAVFDSLVSPETC